MLAELLMLAACDASQRSLDKRSAVQESYDDARHRQFTPLLARRSTGLLELPK
jgi:hypothetical protein